MQIVLKRTEKASPTKIDLRTSFLGIRWDPPVFQIEWIYIYIFFFPQFFFHSETHGFRFRERDKIEKCTIYVYIYNWSWNTIGRTNIEKKQTMVMKQANTNIVRVRVVSRGGGQRENWERQLVSRFSIDANFEIRFRSLQGNQIYILYM